MYFSRSIVEDRDINGDGMRFEDVIDTSQIIIGYLQEGAVRLSRTTERYTTFEVVF